VAPFDPFYLKNHNSQVKSCRKFYQEATKILFIQIRLKMKGNTGHSMIQQQQVNKGYRAQHDTTETSQQGIQGTA